MNRVGAEHIEDIDYELDIEKERDNFENQKEKKSTHQNETMHAAKAKHNRSFLSLIA